MAKTRPKFGTLDTKIHPDAVLAFRQVGVAIDDVYATQSEHQRQLDLTARQADLEKAQGRIHTLEGQVASLLAQAQSLQQQVTAVTTPTSSPNPGPTPGPTPSPVPATVDVTLEGHPTRIFSSPDISSWTATATITSIQLVSNGGGAHNAGLDIHFTKKLGGTRWPDVPFGQGTIQYTIWLIAFMPSIGKWATAGAILVWFDSTDAAGYGGDVLFDTQIGTNWYTNSQLWGPLFNFQPTVGQTIGFIVTAGEQRATDVHTVQERSSIYWVTWPAPGALPVTFNPTGNPSP